MKLIYKRLFLFLLTSLLLLTLVSCSNGISGTYSISKINAAGLSLDIKDSPLVLGENVESYLNLQNDGKFSFNVSISDLNYSASGTWTLDGNTLTLLCDDATSLTGTIDGTAITLGSGGDTIIFEKQ